MSVEQRCEKGECCQGVPYTLSEAEAVYERHGRYMDQYVCDLMGWLIAEVKRLRANG